MTMQSLLEEARHLLETSNWPQMSSRPGAGTTMMCLRDEIIGPVIAVVEGYDEHDRIITISYDRVESWRTTNSMFPVRQGWKLPPSDLHDRIWAEHCAEQLTNG